MSEAIYKSFNVHHAVVSSVKAQLLQLSPNSASGQVIVPSCRVEVWAEDKNMEELAWCQGVLRLGNPLAKVIWLGRSGRRPAHDSVRGVPCIAVKGSDSEQYSEHSVAEVVFGLFAGIADRLGATALDLIADDNGSGRLIKYYSNLGLEKGVHMEGAVWAMRGPTQAIAQLAPNSWLEGMMPRSFDALKWFCSFMSSTAVAKIPKTRHAKLGDSKVLPSMQPPASDRCESLPAMRPASSECQSPNMRRVSRPISAVAHAIGRPCASKSPVKDPQKKPKQVKEIDESLRSLCVNDVAHVQMVAELEEKIQRAMALELTAEKTSSEGHRRKAERQKDTVTPATDMLHSTFSSPCPSPSSSRSRRWRWLAEWPVDAVIDAALTQSRTSKHLRADVSLTSCSGEELAYLRGAIPPKKLFVRVLWLGRDNFQPVHPDVRSRPVYSTCADHSTAAVALLGVMAALACWLDIGYTELQPLDNGSGKLVGYLRSLGFKESADKTSVTSDGAEEGLRMKASSEALAQCCLPVAWRVKLPPHRPPPEVQS